MSGETEATILVVDDESLIRDLLSMALEDEGYRVETAEHGDKAVEILARMRIDLVITDYMMPVKKGDELARAIRFEMGNTALPIILISGAQGSIGQSMPELFDGVIPKPFKPEDLISLIRELLPPATP